MNKIQYLQTKELLLFELNINKEKLTSVKLNNYCGKNDKMATFSLKVTSFDPTISWQNHFKSCQSEQY